MKQFQDLGKQIADLRKPLRWYGFGGVALNVIIILVSVWINFGRSDHRPYSTLEACLYGMQGIVFNNPDGILVNPLVLEEIQSKKITFEVDSIHLIKFIDSFHCDVVVKDPHGVRSFLVSLEKNSKFKHLYRILDVKENPLVSEYQQ